MEGIILQLRSGSTTAQAVGVSIGGLVGVFATLAVFFLISWLAVKVGKRE